MRGRGGREGLWKSLHVCADEIKKTNNKTDINFFFFFHTMGDAGVRKGTRAAGFPCKCVGRGEPVIATLGQYVPKPSTATR